MDQTLSEGQRRQLQWERRLRWRSLLRRVVVLGIAVPAMDLIGLLGMTHGKGWSPGLLRLVQILIGLMGLGAFLLLFGGFIRLCVHHEPQERG